MKTWMLSAALLFVAAVAQAEELSWPSFVDAHNEFALDFSNAEFFAPPTPLEAEWLPPPTGLRDEPCNQDQRCDNACEFLNFTCRTPGADTQSWANEDVFAALAVALANEGIATQCANVKVCACGTKCKCATGDTSKCACGENCACGNGTCKCGPGCKCASGEQVGQCACGDNCACGSKVAQCKSGTCKVAVCRTKVACDTKCACGPKCACGSSTACGTKCACGPKCACGSKVACGSKCACGNNCTCGDAEIAKLKHELVALHQQMTFQYHVSQLQIENQRRVFELHAELADARAEAAAHQAAFQQQSIAQQQQHELVSQIVKLAQPDAALPVAHKHKAADAQLQMRIEQLTIENVQLRHTIDELRRHVEQLAREPSDAR